MELLVAIGGTLTGISASPLELGSPTLVLGEVLRSLGTAAVLPTQPRAQAGCQQCVLLLFGHPGPLRDEDCTQQRPSPPGGRSAPNTELGALSWAGC